MASPNAAGVAALTLAAHPGLKGNPDALLEHLKSTARQTITNYMGPNDPYNYATVFGSETPLTVDAHIDFNDRISFCSDAYGHGIVDAGAAVAPTKAVKTASGPVEHGGQCPRRPRHESSLRRHGGRSGCHRAHQGREDGLRARERGGRCPR